MIGSRALYVIDSVRPGERVVLKRNPDYWAQGHPVQARLRQLRRDHASNYFRDDNAMFEAFKKGAMRHPDRERSGRWASALQFPGRPPTAASSRKPSTAALPSGMYGFVFNTRPRSVQEPRRAARARRLVRLRMGQQEPVLGGLSAHDAATMTDSELSVARPSGQRRGEGAAGSPTPTACRPTSWTAPGRRRPPTAAAATGSS